MPASLPPATGYRGRWPTFAFPVGVGSEADVPAVLAIELRHQGLVGVADEQDGRVKGLDFLLAALVGFDADGPSAPPVISLAFEPFPSQTNKRDKPGSISTCKDLRRAKEENNKAVEEGRVRANIRLQNILGGKQLAR